VKCESPGRVCRKSRCILYESFEDEFMPVIPFDLEEGVGLDNGTATRRQHQHKFLKSTGRRNDPKKGRSSVARTYRLNLI